MSSDAAPPPSLPPQASLFLRGTGATDTGRMRHHNEDVLLIREDLQLFIVADGAGGHDAGEVAAQLATRSITNFVEATEAEARAEPEFDRFGLPNGARRLSRAVHKANRDVHQISIRYERTRGMGTTVVAMLFSPRSALVHVAHAGDSRCYRLRGQHLELLTQDHSILTDVLEERPEIEQKVLASLPKHVVTRALGMRPNLRVSVRSYEAAAGDRYLLCSDGLSGYVAAETLKSLLLDTRPRGAIVQLLLNAANDAGGRDNVSAVVVDSVTEPAAASCLRAPERPQAEPEAPPAREASASGPELLLLGIEELDLESLPPAVSEHPLTEAERAALAKLRRRTPKP